VPRDIEDIASHIVDVAVKLHIEVGPGMRESTYARLMVRGLEERGLKVEQQVIVPFKYKGVRFDRGVRIDPARREAGHRRIEIDGQSLAGKLQAGPHLPAADGLEAGIRDQLRVRNAQAGPAAHRE
jgi:hypothetical protein